MSLESTRKCCRGLIERSGPKTSARKRLGVEAFYTYAAALESRRLPQEAGSSLELHHQILVNYRSGLGLADSVANSIKVQAKSCENVILVKRGL